MNTKIKLSPPWVTYKNYLDAMFGQDPDVEILFNDEEPEVKLVVSNGSKAVALRQILPETKTFGNVTLTINIETTKQDVSDLNLLKAAFNNNPVLCRTEGYDTVFGPVDFAIFKKEVVQFYNDEMYDMNGLKSTLYENIARELFPDMTVHFCTDPE